MGWRWLSFLLILVLMAGCGNPSVISDPHKVHMLHGREKHVITFWHTYNDKETWLLEHKLIPAFEQEYPNIQVESVNLAFNNELKNSLMARSFSNRGPDVVRLDIGWVPEFSAKGFLEPLNKFPGFEKMYRRFKPAAMDVGYNNNNYYSLPLNIYTKAAIFNRVLLKRVGYTKPPKTLAEVIELARQYHFAIGLGGLKPWDTLPYLYSLGGALTDDKFQKASGYLNSETTIHAVEQLTGLYKEKLLELPEDMHGEGEIWNQVKRGTILMTDVGPWFYSLSNKKELDRSLLQTIPIPFPHGKHPSSIIGGENLVIMKGTNQQNEAWTFIKWMTGKRAQLLMAPTGLIPTNQEAVKALKIPQDSYLYTYAEAANTAFQWPPVKNWSKIDQVYTENLDNIFSGRLSVKEGLDRAAVEIDRLLSDPY